MNSEELKKMHEIERTYWWHLGKLKILEALVRFAKIPPAAKILDVGCGTGVVVEFLGRFGEVTGIDISPDAVRLAKSHGLNRVSVGDILSLPYEEEAFDLVVAADVLEHVEEDIRSMKQVWRVLKRGGCFIVMVPAHKFLWSGHDEALGHRRRYTRKEILKKLELAGFTIERVSYSVFFTFPIIFAYRTWQVFFSRSDHPETSYVVLPEILNRLLTKSLYLEAKLLSFTNLPVGVTIVSVARKKE